jgi:hypothetical protein
MCPPSQWRKTSKNTTNRMCPPGQWRENPKLTGCVRPVNGEKTPKSTTNLMCPPGQGLTRHDTRCAVRTEPPESREGLPGPAAIGHCVRNRLGIVHLRQFLRNEFEEKSDIRARNFGILEVLRGLNCPETRGDVLPDCHRNTSGGGKL